MKISEMKEGRIYHISYGGASVLGRLALVDSIEIVMHSQLHYWHGFERFKGGTTRIVNHNIEEIRLATVSEKHNLFKEEIKNDNI